MKKLIRAICKTTGLKQKQIKGSRRINRETSYAKMLYCQLAYDHYRMMPADLVNYMSCSRENIYYLLSAGRNNLIFDNSYKNLYNNVLIELNL